VHGAAHGGVRGVGARGCAGPAAELGEERGGGDAVLEAVERAAAEEAVQTGEHHAAVGELEAAVRERRALVGATLREEEARHGDGRVQPRRARLLLPREVHHLAAADVDPWIMDPCHTSRQNSEHGHASSVQYDGNSINIIIIIIIQSNNPIHE